MRRLLTGGTVWAGAACTPRATWVLVDGDRIAAIGDDDAPGAELPAADERVDVKGGHVLPGFVDVHLHLSQAAWFPQGVDGLSWASLTDALHAVRVQAAADREAPWLLFWRVARWKWPEGRLPTAAELDEAAPGRRVLVSTLDMHRGAISSAGLAALGLTNGGECGPVRWRPHPRPARPAHWRAVGGGLHPRAAARPHRPRHPYPGGGHGCGAAG
jgi:predicted amidohydrolase YtcJ